MTDPSMDIAKYINSNETTLSWFRMAADGAGNNLFVNQWPDTVDEAARLVRYEGKAPDETMGNPVLVRNPRVQLTLRGFDSNVLLTRAEAVMKFLSVVKDQTINGTKYARIKVVGEPFEIGPDAKNREQVTLNLEASFYDVP